MLVFEGKERGDLDPHFHQSLSPLCEGNPLDLDLGVLGVLLLVLPLIFLPSISCFGGIWERRTWALCCGFVTADVLEKGLSHGAIAMG